jgi:hypothetical protein
LGHNSLLSPAALLAASAETFDLGFELTDALLGLATGLGFGLVSVGGLLCFIRPGVALAGHRFLSRAQ